MRKKVFDVIGSIFAFVIGWPIILAGFLWAGSGANPFDEGSYTIAGIALAVLWVVFLSTVIVVRVIQWMTIY